MHLGIKDILASKLDYWECTRLGAAPRDWYLMDYTFFDLERTPSEGREVWWQFQQGKHYIPHCQHVQLLCLPLCLSHTSWLQSEWSSSAAWLPAIRNQLFMYNPLWIVLSKDNLCAFISCHFCVSACSWVSSSYKWGKSFQCGQILGVGWRCQHLNWVPRQVYLWLFNSMTYDPCPVEWTPFKLHIWEVLAEGASDSFFEIQHYFSDSQWMREDGCNGIKDCFVVLLFFARHYDEKQWHLLHMIIVLYKGV